MRSSKIIIYLTIISCILIVAVPTLYKVILDNHQKLKIVNEKLIIEAARNCYFDDKCADTKITLKELYENGYLNEKMADPITKIVYSDDSYVELKKKDSTFNPA